MNKFRHRGNVTRECCSVTNPWATHRIGDIKAGLQENIYCQRTNYVCISDANNIVKRKKNKPPKHRESVKVLGCDLETIRERFHLMKDLDSTSQANKHISVAVLNPLTTLLISLAVRAIIKAKGPKRSGQ